MHEHMSTDAFCLWAGRGSSIGQIKEKSHFKSNDFFSLMVSEGKTSLSDILYVLY